MSRNAQPESVDRIVNKFNNSNNNKDGGGVSVKREKPVLVSLGTDHSSSNSPSAESPIDRDVASLTNTYNSSNNNKQRVDEEIKNGSSQSRGSSACFSSEGRGPPPPPQFDRIAGEKYEKYVKQIANNLKNFDITDKF